MDNDKMEKSDEQLVTAVLGGDREAFADLVRRYEKLVFASVMSLLRNRDIAEEIAQEAFIKAFENLASLKKKETFASWVLQIARRDAYRASRAKKTVSLTLAEEVPSGQSNGRISESSAILLEGLARLPKHQRTVIELSYFENLSAKEVAKMTGRTVGTVTKQLTRARDRLREWIIKHEK